MVEVGAVFMSILYLSCVLCMLSLKSQFHYYHYNYYLVFTSLELMKSFDYESFSTHFKLKKQIPGGNNSFSSISKLQCKGTIELVCSDIHNFPSFS